ncbi:MAG: rhodanese-like domain-containing protein [Phycisphaerales bacterium]
MSGLDERGLPRGMLLNEDWEITPRETRALLADGARNALLLDCRTQEEFARARIEGALLVPLHEMGEAIEDLREHAERTIVVHCHHGRRSLQAAAILRRAGFTDVRSMAGGIDLWSIDIDPGVPRYTK